MTREEAIKYIEQHNHIDDVVKDMCIEALGNDTNVDSKWIPCSERLPKFTNDYNVTVGVANEFGYYEIVTTLRYEIVVGKEPKWIIPTDKVYKVIAWFDLPEPYKGE